ncbi:MAG: radical SAM protein [Myxococcota bacterium]|nr:radical SAM protein [Myxococcota bacterium]
MRIILINPPIDSVIEKGNVNPVTQYLFYNSAPLGILYIASVLEQAGHTVSVVDAAAELLNVESTAQRVADFNADVVGVGSFTVTFESTKALGFKIKELCPDLPIILGSYHVTLVPHEAMSSECFDVGVLGEGEFTMLELVEHYEGKRELADIQGICYRVPDPSTPEGWSLHKTKTRPKFKDLDSLPFPARHLLPPNIYRPIPVDDHAFPKFAMVTSRGCPHACAFCQKSRSGYRSHSPRYIVDEIEHLVRDYGVQDIAFVDSLFCANKKRVHAICDEILRRGLQKKVSWTCSSRVEVVDKPLLQKMKDAGCWRTRFGIESGHDDVLDFISKGITQEKIKSAITAADEVGLRPKAFFMVGHMPDTKERILETINFAKSIPLHDVTVQINTLLPETPQLEIWKREGYKWGRLTRRSTDEKSFWEPTFVPWGLEPEDLIELHRRFYREFYLRPVTLKRHAQAIKNWRDLFKYAQASTLFSFLFFDQERLSVSMVKQTIKDRLGKKAGLPKAAK